MTFPPNFLTAAVERPGVKASLALAFTAFVACLSPAVSGATALTEADELARFGSEGSGAGQLANPGAVTTDPVTGHVYVQSSSRVEEFTPWGEFIMAFGWGVAPGAVNEQQEVRLRAGAGTFRLGFEGQETGDLPFDATAVEVQGALDGLTSIGGASGSVTVTVLAGNVATSTPSVYVVAFEGSLAGKDVPQLTAVNGATALSGGAPKTEIEARTRVDGLPGGGGLEACTSESGCQEGTKGTAMGQFYDPESIAVDSAGDIYIGELVTERVQKFSPTGHFIWMVGGKVDKTTGANLCTVASGDECGVGVTGTGPGEFDSASNSLQVAAAPDGSIVAASDDRLQRFNAAGEYQSKLEISAATGAILSLAIDQTSGDPYVSWLKAAFIVDVHKLDPATGNEIATLKIEGPEGLATDPFGDLFVAAGEPSPGGTESVLGKNPHARVVEFGAEGTRLSVLGEVGPLPNSAGVNAFERFQFGGIGTNVLGDLYATYHGSAPGQGEFVRSFGPPPVSFESPPLRAPEVATQYAATVGFGEATVQAKINPRFWNDTSYHLEYGTSSCSQGGCSSSAEFGLTKQIVGSPATSQAVLLEGLKPGTVYHYRFVAHSTGGGPVYGLDPDGEGPGQASFQEGLEGTFTTYVQPGVEACPENEAFRSGPSALLPDCRAFEMVSPVDKENGDIAVLLSNHFLPLVLEQGSVNGERLAYGSVRAFGGAQSAPLTSQYVATRQEGVGWVSHPISPPRTKEITGVLLEASLLSEFEAFSPDLCQGWLHSVADPPLAEGAPEGFEDVYRRNDEECGGAGYEALNIAKPASGSQVNPILEGIAGDQSAAIFSARGRLAVGGSGEVPQLYYEREGTERFVCFLPNGSALSGACTAGSVAGGIFTSGATAISHDGSLVYWSPSSGGGAIYVREHPGQAQSTVSAGVCTQPTRGCTLPVSATAEGQTKTSGSRFWMASPDGSKALFTNGGGLYEYRLGDQSTHPIAGRVMGLMGASEDLSKVYLASEEILGGTNGEGKSAVEGQANLYFWTEATGFHFIGTLGKKDVGGSSDPSPFGATPEYRDARVSADGEHTVFESFASLTGYDNTDVSSGQADSEVFVYDASGNDGQGKLACASCNPSGARPKGQEFLRNGQTGPWTAGRIAGWESNLYAARVMAHNGQRVFFESFDSLVPADTNGQMDVYEWEAPGEGSCEESTPSYSAQDGGCVSLISTGKSPSDSRFVDASPSASNAFFATGESLLPQDYGLVDIYDARIDGGLPIPPTPPAACEGEACQAPAGAPTPSGFASLSFEGDGNVLVTPLSSSSKSKPRALTTAQRLSRALAKCHHVKSKRKRGTCERQAHKRYVTKGRTGVTRKGRGGR